MASVFSSKCCNGKSRSGATGKLRVFGGHVAPPQFTCKLPSSQRRHLFHACLSAVGGSLDRHFRMVRRTPLSGDHFVLMSECRTRMRSNMEAVVSPEAFVEAWQTSNSLDEVSR